MRGLGGAAASSTLIPGDLRSLLPQRCAGLLGELRDSPLPFGGLRCLAHVLPCCCLLFVCRHDYSRRLGPELTTALEELNCTLMLLGNGTRVEGPKVAALAGLGILLPGVQSVLAGCELPNHAVNLETYRCQHLTRRPRFWATSVGCMHRLGNAEPTPLALAAFSLVKMMSRLH